MTFYFPDAEKPNYGPARICILGAPGAGKAQSLESKILTPDGWMRMGDAKVGDKVINPDGGKATIVGVFPQGKKEIYKINFNDRFSTEACAEHLWTVQHHDQRQNKRGWSVRSTSEILSKMDTLSRNRFQFVPMIKKFDFDQQETLDIDPYTLGLLLGDGGFTRNTPMFSKSDTELIDHLRRNVPDGIIVKNIQGCNFSIRKENRTSHPNPVKVMLEDLSLWGLYSHEKFIPHKYKYSTFNNRVAILQGLFDTDGYPSKANVEFSTSSRLLSEDVIELIQSIGGVAKVVKRSSSYIKNSIRIPCRESYRITVSLPRDVSPFRLQRKADKYNPGSKYPPYRYIKSIEKIGQKEAQCIMLDSENQLYVTDNYIVTHNTRLSATMPDPLFLDLEKGSGSARANRITIEPSANTKSVLSQKLAELNNSKLENGSLMYHIDYKGEKKVIPVKTVIIDSIDQFQENEKFYGVLKGKTRMTVQEWGDLFNVVYPIVLQWMALPVHVVVISHIKQTEGDDTKPGYKTFSLQGGFKDTFPKGFDEIIHLVSGTEGKRTALFQPMIVGGYRYEAKDRHHIFSKPTGGKNSMTVSVDDEGYPGNEIANIICEFHKLEGEM